MADEEVRAILATQSHSPSQIETFERYIDAMYDDSNANNNKPQYLYDACRVLVKLYQLFPDHNKATDANTKQQHVEKYTARCCFLAMLQYPREQDLLSIQYMIPINSNSNSKGSGDKKEDAAAATDSSSMNKQQVIMKCFALLTSCQFIEFWNVYQSELIGDEASASADPQLRQLAQASVPHLQAAIIAVLALSYKEIPMTVLLTNLNMENQAVGAITKIQASEPGAAEVIESIAADKVIFKPSVENTARKTVYQQGVDFATISSLMSKMNSHQAGQ